MDPREADQAAELERWLIGHHIPEVRKVHGCVGARRGILSEDQQPGLSGPRHRFLTLFEVDTDSLADFLRELATTAASLSPALNVQSMWRTVYLQLGERHRTSLSYDPGPNPVRLVSLVFVGPKDPNDIEAYSAYMDTLHVREMLAVPGCIAGTRYRRSPDQPLNAVGPTHPFLNLWEIETPSGTEYQRQLAAHPRTPTPLVDGVRIQHVNYRLISGEGLAHD
jgi:hypothetical protein